MELIEFRRQRGENGKYQKHSKPIIKVEYPKGVFTFYLSTAKFMNIVAKDALMFGFSRKDNCAYVYRETPEVDSYILGKCTRDYYRFTSKELLKYLIDFFKIEPDKNIVFDVTESNVLGKYKIVPSNI